MPTQLLERSEANAPAPDDPLENSPSDLRFRTISDDDVQRLNDLFYRHQCALSRVAVGGAALAAGAAVLGAGGAYATGSAGSDAAANAKTTIENGVKNAIDMIKAIDGIGLAAFGVALAPMGFMVTLRVLNMVLSRV
ncbi:hypothetical protein [Microcoleus sp. OTE_8_concoct_300]|jgi:hypothetical protein|uniref:hypothetical protein n=1 Tax=Microcoleus sp. OTE_8_concoct_300 TaxID=2964710 RepID=UPI00403F22E9